MKFFKRELIVIFFLFFCLYSKAQGDLQFNRVINIVNGDNLTVPTGKVWKLESVNFSSTLTYPIGAMNLVLCQNSVNPPNNRLCDYAATYMTIGNVQFRGPSVQWGVVLMSCATPCPNTNPVALSSSPSSLSLQLPIWLEAGKSVSVVAGTGILISVVEFNIVP